MAPTLIILTPNLKIPKTATTITFDRSDPGGGYLDTLKTPDSHALIFLTTIAPCGTPTPIP